MAPVCETARKLTSHALAASLTRIPRGACGSEGPQSPTSGRASVQETHSRSRSTCAANRRPRARGRPRRTQGALVGWAQKPVAVVAGRSTMRSACARTRTWTPCAGTSIRRLGRRRRTRTLGRGNSYFAGAGSGARAETKDDRACPQGRLLHGILGVRFRERRCRRRMILG